MDGNNENNIIGNFPSPSIPYKKLLENSNKLECHNKYKFSEINNSNIKPIGNNINIDILSEVQIAQNNLNYELHDVKKIFIPFSSNIKYNNKIDLSKNKNETNSHLSNNKEKKINNEYVKENNKRKNMNIKNHNYKKSNYKDIPLTKFFQ